MDANELVLLNFGETKLGKSINEKIAANEVITSIPSKDLEAMFEELGVNDGVKSTEDSKMTQELAEGTILIWNGRDGYIMPNVAVYKSSEETKVRCCGIPAAYRAQSAYHDSGAYCFCTKYTRCAYDPKEIDKRSKLIADIDA